MLLNINNASPSHHHRTTSAAGYLGQPENTVWYGDLPHRNRFQTPEVPKFPYYMREWAEAWSNIDLPEDEQQQQ